MSQIKLTYFDMGGRAEPVRLAFAIGGIQFTDERLSREEFGQKKQSGAFKNDQVPVLEVDGVQYAQSNAILNYAGRLAGIYPKDTLEALRVDQAIGTIDEVQSKIGATFYMPKEQVPAAREKLTKEQIPYWFDRIENLLKENNGFFAGKSITTAELQLFQLVQWLEMGILDGIPKDIAQKYTLIQQSVANVRNHEKVKSYYASKQK